MRKRHDAVVLVTLVGTLHATAVRAATEHFDQGSMILPLDACYARSLGGPGNDSDLEFVIAPSTEAQLGCDSTAEKDDGALFTYGLVIRLVHSGIPVKWIIKPNKTSWHEVDFAITPGSGVRKTHYTTGAQDARYNSIASVQYRGSAFVIPAANVAAARAVMTQAQNAVYGTEGVEPHIAVAAGGFDAPVYATLTGLPKVAVLDVDSAADFTGGSLATHREALIDVALGWGEGVWWDVITPAQLRAGVLDSGGYTLLWVPPMSGFVAANKAANLTAIKSFLARSPNPGYVLFQDSAVWTMEGEQGGVAASWSPTEHAPTPLETDGLGGTYGGNNANEQLRSDDYSDPFAQNGGVPWQGVGGANKAEWQPSGGAMVYNPGVMKVVYSYHLTDASQRNWMLAAWRYYLNSSTKGRILYTGGDNLRRNTMSPYRILLNSLLISPSYVPPVVASDTVEASRSSPTIASVGGVSTMFQGSFEVITPTPSVTTYLGAASEATMEFPYTKGHLRALNAGTLGTTTSFVSVSSIFDANTWLQNLSTPITQRSVFTTLGNGSNPGRQSFDDSSASANLLRVSLSRPSPAATWTAIEALGLIRRVLAGNLQSGVYRARLGGVDRSSPVVVGRSTVTGGNRPTVIYFGATDGMIHAVCGNDSPQVAPCTAAGQELWAFIPQGQLALLWQNLQRIDGAPNAIDAFEDFDGNGTREWRTLLFFQTGNAYGTAEAYALDVTNPDPTTVRNGYQPVSILWRRVLPGSGLSASAGPVRRGAGQSYMAFFLTNNGRDSAGATNAAGIRLTGLDLKDGSFAYGTATDQVSSRGFSFYRGYPVNPPGTRSISSGELSLLASGIPDGASALDLTGGGTISHVVFATLTGELYKVDATVTGTFSSMIAPLAAFTGNYHPIGSTPTIYRDAAGDFHAVVVSGGYADPVSTAWSPATTRQFLVSVELEHTGSTISIPDASGDSNSLGIAGADFRIDLGLGNRAYSSATRIGDQIFVTTQDSSVDVNASTYGGTSGGGWVRQVSLTGVQQGSGTAVSGGANSVSRVGASVYVAGTDQVHNVTATTAIGSGLTSEIVADIKRARKLWLRLE